MAIRGLSMAEKSPYILKADPGHPEHADHKMKVKAGDAPEAPTTFYIGNLSAADRMEIGDMGATPTMHGGSITMKGNAFTKNYVTVKRGLKGWDNFLDENGNAITFETSTEQLASGEFRALVTDECLSRLGRDDISELASEIMRKNGLTSEMEKNFAGLSQQLVGQPSETGVAQTAETSSESNEDAQPQQSSPERSKTS